MQQIPGVYSADQTISNINVRSGTHDQNLFLWNGIRLFQTGHFFGLISSLNPNLAHTISISKNGNTCAVNSDSVNVTVIRNTLSITPNESITLCSGDSILLTGSSINGASYQWMKNNTNVFGATGQAHYAKTMGSTIHLLHIIQPISYPIGMEIAHYNFSDVEKEMIEIKE